MHAAQLTAGSAAAARWRWGHEVVLKVQHLHMETLMQSDLRNLGRLARVCRDVTPFDFLPVTLPPPLVSRRGEKCGVPVYR